MARSRNRYFAPARSAGASVLFAVLVAAAGCQSSSASSPKASDVGSEKTQEHLRLRLSQFYTSFVNIIESAIQRAGEKQNELDVEYVRRLTLTKIRLVRTCRTTVFQDNVMAAFLDTWALCLQCQTYVQGDRVPVELGVAVPVMKEATSRLVLEIETIGHDYLPPKQFKELRDTLVAYAKENPFSTERIFVPPSTKLDPNLPVIGFVLNLPLAPFRAMQGVDKTAVAVNEGVKVADRISRLVGSLPVETAWQLELLLLQVRRDVEVLLAEADAKQAGLRTTLQEARATLAEADTIVARIEPILGSAKETAGGIATAVGGADQLLRTASEVIQELNPPKSPEVLAAEAAAPKGPPFDIRDYARAIEGVTDAARELRGLTAEVRTTMESPALTRELARAQATAQATLADAQTSARAILAEAQTSTTTMMDAALLRGIALIAAALVAALIYRVVTMLWLRPRGR